MLALPSKRGWKPQQREAYCRNTIQEIFLKTDPSQRLTISDLKKKAHWIEDETGFNRHTLTRHVDYLLAVAEIVREFDHDRAKYRRVGKVLEERTVEASQSLYRIALIELDGQYSLRIQTCDALNQITGGIVIPIDDLATLKANASLERFPGSANVK